MDISFPEESNEINTISNKWYPFISYFFGSNIEVHENGDIDNHFHFYMESDMYGLDTREKWNTIAKLAPDPYSVAISPESLIIITLNYDTIENMNKYSCRRLLKQAFYDIKHIINKYNYKMNIPLYILASGNWFTSMLYQVCKRNIPDMFDDEISVQELATTLGLNKDSLYRIIRALSVVDIFMLKNDVVKHTSSSRQLREDHKSTMKWFILMRGSESQYSAWEDISPSIENGLSSFTFANGMNLFKYMSVNKEESMYFHKAMATISRSISSQLKDILSNIDTSIATNFTVCDIGGGNGELIYHSTLGTNMIPILFDMKEVVNTCVHPIQKVHGSFFNEADIPFSSIYIMKYILHDWSDEKCIQILSNIKNRMNKDSKLLVIEGLLDGTRNQYHTLLDVQMMVLLDTGARERYEYEYKELAAKVGLKHDSTIHLDSSSLSVMIFTL